MERALETLKRTRLGTNHWHASVSCSATCRLESLAVVGVVSPLPGTSTSTRVTAVGIGRFLRLVSGGSYGVVKRKALICSPSAPTDTERLRPMIHSCSDDLLGVNAGTDKCDVAEASPWWPPAELAEPATKLNRGLERRRVFSSESEWSSRGTAGRVPTSTACLMSSTSRGNTAS